MQHAFKSMNHFTPHSTKLLAFGVLFLCLNGLFGPRASAGVVSNVRASQRAGTDLVEITYDLVASPNAAQAVSVGISTNSGATHTLTATNLTGAVGNGVTPGNNKQIVWNAGLDWPTKSSSTVKFRVTATEPPPTTSSMALIPAGSFAMGDSLNDSSSSSGAYPIHTVYVSTIFMGRTEVTKSLWDDVHQWALTNRYSFENPAIGKSANHPVHVNWYDAVKWCNARSEREGLVPAYYTSATQTTVYRSGRVNAHYSAVKWNAGYRLPTEAEWEKAARGGLARQRFPWGNTISHNEANYNSLWLSTKPMLSYDMAAQLGNPPLFSGSDTPYTAPVGSFSANAYGLHDMAGNVLEWCWDWADETFYAASPAIDPRGSDGRNGTSARIIRGGGWQQGANDCRNAFRGRGSLENKWVGFRLVLAATEASAESNEIVLLDQAPGKRVGDATLLVGNVWAIRNGTKITLSVGATIYEEDVIGTGSRSFVKIVMTDKSVYNIGPESRMGVVLFVAGDRSIIDLLKEFIRAEVAPKKSTDTPREPPVFIRTPIMYAGVRGTEFTVEYQESAGIGTTTVSVVTGVVETTDKSTGAMVTLSGGESRTVQGPVPPPDFVPLELEVFSRDPFLLSISGKAGSKIRIQRSSDLIKWTDWGDLITLGNTPVQVPNSNTNLSSVGFYRAVIP